jgi:flagellar hook-associated protein 1 FlgK
VSLFSTLNTANTALSAQQRAIEVTGQNVANVNTDGYSRQRVDMQSVGGTAVPAIWSVSNQVGSGVDADTVTRIRDAFLEARAQTEHASTSSLTVQDDTYTQVQQAFREPGTTGIQSMLSDFWAGFGDIANNATDPGARSQLLQRAQTLAAGLHTTTGALDQQWSQTRDGLSTLLTDVNATARSIAELNQNIKSATMSKLQSNDLQDKRDTLVLQLADQIGATATPMDDGTLTVTVGGISLVSGNNAIQLSLTGGNSAADVNADPAANSIAIVTTPGSAVVRAGGTAAGQLTTMNSIIPGYEKQLDGVAQQLADQVNSVHETGYDLYGTQGGAFFDDGSGGTTGITAANISVAVTDPKKIAAAALSPVAANGQISADHTVADQLYQLRLGIPNGTSYDDGADSVYRKMIVALGVQASTTANSLTTQSAVSTQVDASRESVSGVNIDEEMTNMLQYQHAYAAAGQLVSTVQSMMDTLINMVGR